MVMAQSVRMSARRVSKLVLAGSLALLAACAANQTDRSVPPLGGTDTATGGDPMNATGFPSFWPVPPYSGKFAIPSRWLPPRGAPTLLLDVADRLVQALGAAGYEDWSFLAAPNGFALVTQMEQIEDDGTPSPNRARWSTDLPSAGNMGLWDFIKALAGAKPGYYRVIVFLVTDQSFAAEGERPTGADFEGILTAGHDRLPPEIYESLPYGPDHTTTALVYEFKKKKQDQDAVSTRTTGARNHLQKAGLYETLSEAP